jgi:predicted enzyme related to lactoylglutathione lyase
MNLERIVLAATDVPAMVEFYNRVFNSSLEPLGYPGSFHRGGFPGTPLLLCPNSVAEVDARQNCHPFRVAVADFDGTIASVLASGGRVVNDDTHDGQRVAGISDPDGNTYEIVEVS